MAEENEDGQEKTEEPSDERRLEFREKGEIAFSRELSSVSVLVCVVAFLGFFALKGMNELSSLLRFQFESLSLFRISKINFISYASDMWIHYLKLVVPFAAVAMVIASLATFLQTRFNISFKKISPNWGKLNPLAGVKRMFSAQALVELFKSLAKMTVVSLIAYLILYGERANIPGLMNLPIPEVWIYWGKISQLMVWSVSGFLLAIAIADYFYNFMTLEKKMRMTKQEIKDEYKQREVNPQIKQKMRRTQRDISTRKAVTAAKEATVIITNPTHYSVALKYELGMNAPVVVAMGVDFVALKIREVADLYDIPKVENRPLARALYKTANVDQEIPGPLFKAVSEVIRYVFKLKGIRVKNED